MARYDLDKLFGLDDPTIVVLGGVEYRLKRRAALTTQNLIDITHAGEAIENADLQNPSTEDIARLEKPMDGILSVLCPNLPLAELTLMMKVEVFKIWSADNMDKSPNGEAAGS